LLAIEPIAAHCESCSPWFSNTNRTARSRTSGEYLVDLFMTPSSQKMESPGIPGRFTRPTSLVFLASARSKPAQFGGRRHGLSALLPSDQVPAVAGDKTEAIDWCNPERPGHRLAFDHAQSSQRAAQLYRAATDFKFA
jgi:hypothetical protein